MSVRIPDLPVSVLASYEEAAVARGISLDALLRESLIQHAPPPPSVSLSGDEWEKEFDDFFDSFPGKTPLPDEAFDREGIYAREDKW
jgi:hypothetical protein